MYPNLKCEITQFSGSRGLKKCEKAGGKPHPEIQVLE